MSSMNLREYANRAKRVTDRLRVAATVLLLVAASAVSTVAAAPAASATSPAAPTSKSFCSAHGSRNVDPPGKDSVWMYRGVPACKATDRGTISYKGVLFSSPYGFQCIEYAERYFYAITGKPPAQVSGHLGNGRDIAENIGKVYGRYYHVSKATKNYASTLVAGDIISMWGGPGTDPAGHVAVVTKVSLDHGTGSIYLIDENGASPASSFIRVKNGVMTYGSKKPYYYTVFQWVYGLPGTSLAPRPKPPTLPAAPSSLHVQSTTNTSAKLTWTDASNNESNFASQYKVGNGAWTPGPSVGANVTAMTVSGLKASTTYTFQIGAHNGAGTRWSAYTYGATKASPPPPAQSAPPAYHAGFKASIDRHATGGVSGHTGPSNTYRAGPTRAKDASIWIVCYVSGQSITGPYGTTTMWDLSDDGYYYTDAWIYTGSNSPVVPRCARRAATVDKHATGGVSGHTGPGNAYKAGPTRPTGTTVTLMCYVSGQSITGPYGASKMWDLATDGYYYTDAWIYTGSNSAVVPRC